MSCRATHLNPSMDYLYQQQGCQKETKSAVRLFTMLRHTSSSQDTALLVDHNLFNLMYTTPNKAFKQLIACQWSAAVMNNGRQPHGLALRAGVTWSAWLLPPVPTPNQ